MAFLGLVEGSQWWWCCVWMEGGKGGPPPDKSQAIETRRNMTICDSPGGVGVCVNFCDMHI